MSKWFKHIKELAVLVPGAFTALTATGCGADNGIGVADDSNLGVSQQHYDLNYLAQSYFYCGTEWGDGGKPDTCHLGQGGKYVAFGWTDTNNGANSSYIFKYFPAGDVRCSNDSFPGQNDPAPGKTKTCYFANMGKVADEGAQFTPYSVTGAGGTVDIVFGGDSGYFSLPKTVSAFDKITCDSTTFAYPSGHVTGAPLACYQLLVGYHKVATAFQTFTVTPNKPIPCAYGSGGYWNFRTLTAGGNGQLTCNPADFGLMGGGGNCYVLDLGNNYLAAENQSFSMPRGYDTYPVVYSSGWNGNNIMRNLRSGTCNNTTFTDPQWGMQKNCYGTALIH